MHRSLFSRKAVGLASPGPWPDTGLQLGAHPRGAQRNSFPGTYNGGPTLQMHPFLSMSLPFPPSPSDSPHPHAVARQGPLPAGQILGGAPSKDTVWKVLVSCPLLRRTTRLGRRAFSCHSH